MALATAASGVLVAGVVVVAGGSPRATGDGNLGLAPPSNNHGGGDNPAADTPLGGIVVIRPCEEVDAFTGSILEHVPPDLELGTAHCYLTGPSGHLPEPGERDIWSAGVVYIPDGLTPNHTLVRIVEADGVHLQWRFNMPGPGRGPPPDDPNDPDGGHVGFEKSHDVPARVQRISETVSRVGWVAPDASGRRIVAALESGRSPEEVVEITRSLTDGPPLTSGP